jgi:hypothetical protein
MLTVATCEESTRAGRTGRNDPTRILTKKGSVQRRPGPAGGRACRLLVDGAGCHIAAGLADISLSSVHLPLRLSAIIDSYRDAWNRITAEPSRLTSLTGYQADDCINGPEIEAAWLDRDQYRVGDGERGTQAAGVAATHIDDDIGILRLHAISLGFTARVQNLRRGVLLPGRGYRRAAGRRPRTAKNHAMVLGGV